MSYIAYAGFEIPATYQPSYSRFVDSAPSAPPRPIPPAPERPRDIAPLTNRAGMWQSETCFLPQDFFPQMNTTTTAPPAHYTSREDMLRQELEAREANGRREGMKVSNKGLRETAEGLDKSAKPISISSSRMPDAARPSLEHSVAFSEGALRGQAFTTRYLMVKNSTLNGATYDSPDGAKQVTDSVSSSLDRYTPNMTLARMVDIVDAQGKSERVCYAGRPDTADKFKELAQMIFLGERLAGKQLPKRGAVYELSFAMNSFIGTNRFGAAEKELIEREMAALRQFHGSNITLMDENGKPVSVNCRVLFFNRQFNFTNKLEEALPDDLSGKETSESISASVADLEREFLTPQQQQDPLIAKCLRLLRYKAAHNLSSLDELFLRTLIFELADIPAVFHCRSCVDRTAIAVAMACAIKTWRTGHLRIDENNPLSIMDEETFKELWWANIPPALVMSAYSREQCGFKWMAAKQQCTMHPAVLRLAPSRCLANFSLATADSWGSRAAVLLRHPIRNVREWAFGPTAIPFFGQVFKTAVVAVGFFSMVSLVALVLGLLPIPLLFAALLSKKLKGFHPMLLFQLIYAIWHVIPDKVLKPDTELFAEPVLFQGKGKARPPENDVP